MNRHTIIRGIVMVALALGLVSSFVLPVSAAVESAPPHAAGLIVDYGDGALSYAWVPFAAEQISGVDLLRMSDLPILTVGFGGMGEAVCKIVLTGCDVSPCRQRLCQTADRSSPYWQYLRLGPDGLWKTQPLGGSSSIVTDGVVDAWVWAGGDSTPNLPALSLAAIAEQAGAGSTAVQLSDGRQALRPFVRTTGGDPQLDSGMTSSRTEYLAAALLLLTIAGAGGAIVWRARLMAGRSRS